MRRLILFLVILASAVNANAQMCSISTNLVDWANLGTANLEMGLSVGRHLTAIAGARYNQWSFESKKRGNLVEGRQQTAYAGIKYWPWYVNSGWWLKGKAQYSSSSKCGVWRPEMETGTAVGAGVSCGYSVMLSKHLNLEFGAGIWGGGYTGYTRYECSDCLDIIASGPRGFLLFDDLDITVTFIF